MVSGVHSSLPCSVTRPPYSNIPVTNNTLKKLEVRRVKLEVGKDKKGGVRFTFTDIPAECRHYPLLEKG
jgi:hypothetical protein